MRNKQKCYWKAIVNAHARLISRYEQYADEETDVHDGVTVDGSDPW